MNDDSLAELLAQARKKGTDKQFREWVQRQPSCISGRYSEWVNGEGLNPACHVRRAGESGIAHKAEFACLPMTWEEHACQHQHGEAACLDRHLQLGIFTNDEAKDWFSRQRLRYLHLWLAS